MDITAIMTDAMYQEFGPSRKIRNFDCEVICTIAEDPDTGENSYVLLIHDFERKAVISLEAAPVVQAVNLQRAKNNLRKGR